MKPLLYGIGLLWALLLSLAVLADGLNDTFSDAESFAGSKNAGIFSNITDSTVADKVPYYGTPPSETSFYHGGHGDAELSQSGTDKVTNCAGYTPGGNAMLDQECDAVNFIAGHPQNVQHVPLSPSDAIFQNTAQARSNAQSVFDSSGITTSTDGQCTVETNTIPEVKTQRICTSVKEIDFQECLAPRNIVYAQNVDLATGKTVFTVVSNDYELSACSHLAGNSAYEHLGSTCESTVPLTLLPEGVSLTDAAPDGCFVMRHSYAGLTGIEDNSECELYDSDAACTFQGNGACQQTLNLNGQSICTEQEKKYLCTTSPEIQQTTLNCAGQKFCINGNCYSTSNEPDKDFTQSVSAMEAIRQAGVYLNENTLRIFDGDASKCRVKLSGVVNCCKSSSGGGSFNNNLLFNLSVQVGKNVLSYGSNYLYDALYVSDAPNWLVRGVSAIYGVDPTKIPAGGLLGAWSPSLSYFGFTVSLGEIAPGFVSNLIGMTTIPQYTFPPLFGTNITVGFDPSSLAISLAIMVIQDLMSCEPDEQILAMKKGENLCTQVGSYCSKKVFGVCLVRKRSFCCFNSRLGRIINEQGRAQIGKGWGSPKDPICSGFTTEEFGRINFAALDLSEFTREIMDAVKLPNASDLRDNAQEVINRRVNSYYETGSQIGQ